MPRTSRRQIIKISAIAAALPFAGSAIRAAEKDRRLGRDGPVVSAVGLGCNNFGRRLDAAGTERVVHAAVDLGITLFDTADVYGRGASEEYLGQALGPRRSKVLNRDKVWSCDGQRPVPGRRRIARRDHVRG